MVDSSAIDHTTVFVSAGRRGLDLEIGPADLVRITEAIVDRVGRPVDAEGQFVVIRSTMCEESSSIQALMPMPWSGFEVLGGLLVVAGQLHQPAVAGIEVDVDHRGGVLGLPDDVLERVGLAQAAVLQEVGDVVLVRTDRDHIALALGDRMSLWLPIWARILSRTPSIASGSPLILAPIGSPSGCRC